MRARILSTAARRERAEAGGLNLPADDGGAGIVVSVATSPLSRIRHGVASAVHGRAGTKIAKTTPCKVVGNAALPRCVSCDV